MLTQVCHVMYIVLMYTIIDRGVVKLTLTSEDRKFMQNNYCTRVGMSQCHYIEYHVSLFSTAVDSKWLLVIRWDAVATILCVCV